MPTGKRLMAREKEWDTRLTQSIDEATALQRPLREKSDRPQVAE
ncbi:hypothetical protein QEV83_18180 [Methylocapsa sp. D3K7]|jgi:hypothetical protein|nr:hypothetical protein [Methylocapsa sp. D3K7]WGJ14526.1 hypothetical protein QEV83_18180 [Methylocapsa sp. D3K7]